MKKFLWIIVVVTLCLTGFCGCDPSFEETETTGVYCRVEAISEEGFVASVDGKNIFVVYAQADQFEEYDTVVIAFSQEDLRAESGIVPDSYGYEIDYAYVLENPSGVRPAGPGEPTFA